MTEVFVRIPEERVAVLIGTGGAVKKAIEQKSGAHLEIDRDDNSVLVTSPPTEDPWGAMKARDVVLAIGRGFSPERAFRLFQGESYLSVLDMKEISGKRTKDAMRRLRARLIGEQGRARERVEELSGCSVSVYGAAVALIGTAEQLERGERGVKLLLRGSEHGAVYSYLERARVRSITGPEEPTFARRPEREEEQGRPESV
ncbi:MAG: RNA-processing protein [Euryarchaeota archaeon]|nr:RNA-processing protein [Euryarchaeota archaeon]MDE1835176.1 RNA-processing protein [Euryarchaeota archaeon]MDE1880413.1 RNA-processing protein [Euryarchaeota archaeon]MDE2045718.1 RNA-processing protein [Thermoplasmata archaeon]